MKGGKVEFANTLRGFAAVSVLISHYYGVFWGGPSAVGSLINAPAADVSMPTYLNWLHLIPHFNWGAFGVALFFLVSGFVIPFSLRRTNVPSFLVGRILRIFPVYAVGFSISLLAIYSAGEYFGRPWPFSLKEILIHYVPGIRDLLWSRNIDGIIWTLEIEMKFYLLCAAVAVFFRRGSILVFCAPVAVGAISLVASSYLDPMNAAWPNAYFFLLGAIHSAPYLVFMFIGVTFHYAHAGLIRSEAAVMLASLMFFGYVVVVSEGPYAAQLGLAWNYGLAVVAFGIAASYPLLFRASRIGDFFADISYPLYAVHGVAGYVALRFLVEAHAPAWLSLIIVTCSAIALAWLIHVLVEVPSHNLGRHLGRRIAEKRATDSVSAKTATA